MPTKHFHAHIKELLSFEIQIFEYEFNKSEISIKTRAAEHGFGFVKKSDDWGRMLSYHPMIPKLFPKFSEYDLLRDSSMKYYDCIKVFNMI